MTSDDIKAKRVSHAEMVQQAADFFDELEGNTSTITIHTSFGSRTKRVRSRSKKKIDLRGNRYERTG